MLMTTSDKNCFICCRRTLFAAVHIAIYRRVESKVHAGWCKTLIFGTYERACMLGRQPWLSIGRSFSFVTCRARAREPFVVVDRRTPYFPSNVRLITVCASFFCLLLHCDCDLGEGPNPLFYKKFISGNFPSEEWTVNRTAKVLKWHSNYNIWTTASDRCRGDECAALDYESSWTGEEEEEMKLGRPLLSCYQVVNERREWG